MSTKTRSYYARISNMRQLKMEQERLSDEIKRKETDILDDFDLLKESCSIPNLLWTAVEGPISKSPVLSSVVSIGQGLWNKYCTK